MTRVQITAVIAVIIAVAATWIAHLGDTLTRQLAAKSPPEVTRTRVITSILDPEPTVVGSIRKPAEAAKAPGELRR